MSLVFATQLTAVATVALAVFAIVTAVFAILAFRKQSKEVSDQAEMLQVQSSRLGLQERGFEEQRTINRKRDELFDRQLRESEQRMLIIERQQAEMIDLSLGSYSQAVPGLDPSAGGKAWMADVANGSPRPIRNVAGRIVATPGAPAQEAALAAVWAEFGQSPIAGAPRNSRALINPPERPDIPLVRADRTGGLIFPLDADQNPDGRISVRFTDDADLHWQINHDLHLEKLDNRDDW